MLSTYGEAEFILLVIHSDNSLFPFTSNSKLSKALNLGLQHKNTADQMHYKLVDTEFVYVAFAAFHSGEAKRLIARESHFWRSF